MPSSNELAVGRISGLFGIQGELKCDPSSAGRMLFSPGAHFRALLTDGSEQGVELQSVRGHKNRLLVRLSGANDANAAERFVGATFYADRERILLEPGEYLDRDLVDCVLSDSSGHAIGKVSAVEHYPSSDMLIVNGNMVPMVSAFIKSIDVAAKRIVVDLPTGLLDDENAEQA